jgi:hypothetical protein
MNKDKILKYLVPVVAVVVLGESVMLISGMGNKGGIKPVEPGVNVEPAKMEESVKGNEVYNIKIESDKTEYKVGESGNVRVVMVGNVDKALDSINAYVKYDPSAFEASNMEFDQKLPAPAFSKVSTLKSLLVANFLIADPDGLKLIAKEELLVMSFNIKALKAGAYNFEISTGKEMKESATMIVENGTSKPLAFSSNKLSVNVIGK